MRIKTNELSGVQLDWAVAKCEGLAEGPEGSFWVNDEPCAFEPISNWAQGGPIIEREGIQIVRVGDVWEAWVDADGVFCQGPTPLISAMRCYVGSKLGNEIEIPIELEPCES